MQVVQWGIERLKANPANYREHPAEQVAEIVASIERFGWREPLVVRPSDGIIIAGHGRMLAAEQIGAVLVPVVEWECTQEEADAFLVASNATPRGAVDNGDKLAALLERIATQRQGLAGVGYSAEDKSALLDRLAQQRERLAQQRERLQAANRDEDAPKRDKSDSSVCSISGSSYQLGKHVLVCGDAPKFCDIIRRQWTKYARKHAIEPGAGALE